MNFSALYAIYDLLTGFGQIGCGGQTVVARTDDDDVVAAAHSSPDFKMVLAAS